MQTRHSAKTFTSGIVTIRTRILMFASEGIRYFVVIVKSSTTRGDGMDNVVLILLAIKYGKSMSKKIANTIR